MEAVPCLIQLCHRRQDVLVRGPDPEVDLDELPAHDALFIDDERGGMGDHTPGIRVEDPVTIDDRVVGVSRTLNQRS